MVTHHEITDTQIKAIIAGAASIDPDAVKLHVDDGGKITATFGADLKAAVQFQRTLTRYANKKPVAE